MEDEITKHGHAETRFFFKITKPEERSFIVSLKYDETDR